MDAGNARYESARDEVVTYYDEKLSTRRRTPETPTILIMQRLHLDDLVGWIEKNEPDLWDIVKVQESKKVQVVQKQLRLEQSAVLSALKLPK